MNDDVQKRQDQLDVLVKLGVAQLGAGHLTSETLADLDKAAAGFGLSHFTALSSASTLFIEQAPPAQPVLSRIGRTAQIDAINCEQLRMLDIVAGAIGSGKLSAHEAVDKIKTTVAMNQPWWWSTLGLIALGFFVTLQVGVSPFVAVIAGLLHGAVSLLGLVAGRVDVPRLFRYAAQTLFGGVIALALLSIGVLSGNSAAACVAVSWALLVPLPLVLGTSVDATSGEYQSALVRAMGMVVAVGGIAIGAILSGLLARGSADLASTSVELPVVAPLLSVVFCLFGAMANALANGGGARLLIPAAAAGVLTAVCNQLLQHVVGVQPIWASAISAAVLGLVALPCAKWAGYPAPVLTLMGITGALLPGLTVYQGIVDEFAHHISGGYFKQAALVVVGLGVGSAFGFLIASFTGRHGQWARQPRT